MTPFLFLCTMIAPAYVVDGDTLRCQDRTYVRIAAVNAPDANKSSPCRQHRPGYVCNDRLAAEARDRVKAIVMGREMQCRAVGYSYNRAVASCTVNGQDLRCQVIKAQAGVDMPGYVRAYGLEGCK